MKTFLAKIEDIKTNPNNPRIIKDDKFRKLVNSIKEFPKMLNIRPIVVNDSMIVLGGNMRLKACIDAGLKEVPVINASDLTEEEQRRFIIADNVGYGEWDWEMLANEFDADELKDWGLDVIGTDVDSENMTEGFTLPDGDKSPFRQMTFTLADEQAVEIENAIDGIKKTDEYKFAETMGNENTNGNALHVIIKQWAGQKK